MLSISDHLDRLTLVEGERAHEVSVYLSEMAKTRHEMQSGLTMHIDLLAKFDFFTHQFLANAGYFIAKQQQQLNPSQQQHQQQSLTTLSDVTDTLSSGESSSSSNVPQQQQQSSSSTSSSIFGFVSQFLSDEASMRRSAKRRYAELEKRLEDQIDATLVLNFDSHITNVATVGNDSAPQRNWHWLEIVRLFETFLMTTSSMSPKFEPTGDAVLLMEANMAATSGNSSSSSSQTSKRAQKFNSVILYKKEKKKHFLCYVALI